jgi:hypothetical protein
VREQEQSFNTIDVADACVTITVNGWRGTGFAPLDEQRYSWEEGRWRVAPSAEAAH